MAKQPKDIEAFVITWLKMQLDLDVDSSTHFATVGMDSLDAVRFIDELSAFVGLAELPVSLFFEHPTPAQLATCLAGSSFADSQGKVAACGDVSI